MKAGFKARLNAVGDLTWKKVGLGAAVNASWNGIQAMRYGGNFSDMLRSMAKGAVFGAIGAVTGSFLEGFGTKSGLFLYAAAHGVSGGVLNVANGGSFKDGFVGRLVGFGINATFAGPGSALKESNNHPA